MKIPTPSFCAVKYLKTFNFKDSVAASKFEWIKEEVKIKLVVDAATY